MVLVIKFGLVTTLLIKKKKAIFIIAFFVFFSCNTEHKNYNLYALCLKKNNENQFNNILNLKKTDSLFFYCDTNNIGFNTNIPFKKLNDSLFVLTKTNKILLYSLNKKDSIIKPITLFSIPKKFTKIADYFIENDSTLLFTERTEKNYLYRLKNNTIDTVINDLNLVWNAQPYLGLSIKKVNDFYILPFIKKEDNSSGSFLAIYNSDFMYIKGIGNMPYEKDTIFAPFYDVPILSYKNENSILATFNRGTNIVEYEIIKNKLYIKKIYFFPTHFFEKKNINITDLDNHNLILKEYITSNYNIRIINNDKFIGKIIKHKQPLINKKTRRINTINTSKWTLEVLSLKSKKIKRITFSNNDFFFTSCFYYNDVIYIQKQNNSNNIITLYGYK